jgi:hypothetical protein
LEEADIHYERQLTFPEAREHLAVSKSETSRKREWQWFKDRAYRLAVQQDMGARFGRFSQEVYAAIFLGVSGTIRKSNRHS